jgi:NAD(P)-dependent dehydrogenase (short-subunit alcohol dehydrogenase family)
MRLKGKTAIITASGRGIGRQVALTLAEEGARVAVNSSSEENTMAVVDAIKGNGGEAIGVAGDITRADLVVEMVAQTIEAFGRIDIVVNNVGGVVRREDLDMDSPLATVEALWDGTYNLSLKAPVLMCEAVAPHFMEQRSGKIVNMASIAGRSAMHHTEITPIPFPYHSMKAGLIRYTQLLADQLGPFNINANCVCPGIIYTDAWKRLAERVVQNHPKYKGQDPREWFLGLFESKYLDEGSPRTPLRREQTTQDVARTVIFLVSDDAQNITGQALNVDGGMVKS